MQASVGAEPRGELGGELGLGAWTALLFQFGLFRWRPGF